jgi:hypothetical protein
MPDMVIIKQNVQPNRQDKWLPDSQRSSPQRPEISPGEVVYQNYVDTVFGIIYKQIHYRPFVLAILCNRLRQEKWSAGHSLRPAVDFSIDSIAPLGWAGIP